MKRLNNETIELVSLKDFIKLEGALTFQTNCRKFGSV
jgi:hypothetical protein